MSFVLGRIKIEPKTSIYMILILTLFMGTLNDDFGMTDTIRFGNDFFTFLLLISLIMNKKWHRTVKYTNLKYVNSAILFFTCVNIISAIFNFVPINLVIWAIRNTYRFFVFFWACVVYLERKDLHKIFSLLYKIQWINVIVILYQFFLLGLKQDNLGGIFGHGGNAGLLIYCILLLAYAVSKYTSKEYSLFKFVFILTSTCIISAIAELRVFFILFGIVLLIDIFCKRVNHKKILLILGAGLLFIIAVRIYADLFPYVDLSFEAVLEEGSGTGGGYNISRLNAFSELNSLFFNGNLMDNLVGYGFGNCEFSSLSVFSSDFYDKFGYLNYRWFSNQWVFLETGYAGVISFCSIIVTVFIISVKNYRKLAICDKALIETCVIMAIVCFISFFYNSLLKADFGFIAFFSLAIIGVLIKVNYEEKRD